MDEFKTIILDSKSYIILKTFAYILLVLGVISWALNGSGRHESILSKIEAPLYIQMIAVFATYAFVILAFIVLYSAYKKRKITNLTISKDSIIIGEQQYLVSDLREIKVKLNQNDKPKFGKTNILKGGNNWIEIINRNSSLFKGEFYVKNKTTELELFEFIGLLEKKLNKKIINV